MTKQEFYDELNTAITVGCSLPFSVPEKAIDNLVKYSAQWFHRNWDDGVENIYLSILYLRYLHGQIPYSNFLFD